MSIPANESRPGGGSEAAESVVATHLQSTSPALLPHLPEPEVHWGDDPFPIRLGPLEPLDDCPDCHGAVQRLARHSEGLGELWELPLSINTAATPLAPLNRRGLREVAAIFTECARRRGEVAA